MCTIDAEIRTMDYLKFLLQPLWRVLSATCDWSWLKFIMLGIVAGIQFFVHENILSVAVLFGLVLIDQLSGVWAAIKQQTFQSSAFRNGVIKLLFYCVIVAAFHSLEYINRPIFEFLKLDSAALTWLATTEVISIVENSCTVLGLPFPTWLMDKLHGGMIFGRWKSKTDPGSKVSRSLKH